MTDEIRMVVVVAFLAGAIMVLGGTLLIRAHARMIARGYVRIREKCRKITP